MSWAEMGEWWLAELAGDPAYEAVITPMIIDVLEVVPGETYLDLGCGEGRIMAEVERLGGRAHGVEINRRLASRAAEIAPTVIGRLPGLSFIRPGSYDGAYCVLVLEHIADHRALFASAAAVVRPGGIMALVVNHPTWTAPRSTPITDRDGEVLWRPGEYLADGESVEPAGRGTVTFHHRSMSSLLNAAADAGWSLSRMVESAHHEHDDQMGIPRLMASRWSLLP